MHFRLQIHLQEAIPGGMKAFSWDVLPCSCDVPSRSWDVLSHSWDGLSCSWDVLPCSELGQAGL